jgi:hypothetical protein
MAENLAEVFTNLNAELTNVSNALSTQGITNVVLKYDGSQKLYREWIKSIEKYATLVNIPHDKKKLIAYQSSSGAVSGFIFRYMEANPNNTWEQLKRQLALRFSDVTSPQIALSMLRQVKQKVGENIQIYAERILSLAEEAYDNQGGNAIERQLIDTFVDGLINDQLKMKILRDRPDNLQNAIGIATNEQNLRARVAMSAFSRVDTRGTPMEVDHSRGQKYQHKFHRVNEVQSSRSSVKCWACGELGHVIRECRSEKRANRPMGHGRSFNQNPMKKPGQQEN